MPLRTLPRHHANVNGRIAQSQSRCVNFFSLMCPVLFAFTNRIGLFPRQSVGYAKKLLNIGSSRLPLVGLLLQGVKHVARHQTIPDLVASGGLVKDIHGHDPLADCHRHAAGSINVAQGFLAFGQSLFVGFKCIGHRARGGSTEGLLLTSDLLPDFAVVGAMALLLGDRLAHRHFEKVPQLG